MANFDEIIDRRNTNSLKYDFHAQRGQPEGNLPLWVADMDFKAPQAVIDAVVKAAKHGIYGYSNTKEDYFQSLHSWFHERFGWDVNQEWLVKTPGIVYAIATAVRAYTNPGESVLINQPVYYPFENVVRENGRKLVVSQLVLKDGRYEIDFADFEAKIRDNNVKLFILCSPHNPVGRVWAKDELLRIGEICLENNVIVIADEIHMDFVFPPHQHSVFARKLQVQVEHFRVKV